MAYRITPIPMTLSDPEGQLRCLTPF